MKKLLLIIGIIGIIAGGLSLLIAAWSGYAYYHVLDGSSELYRTLHLRMIRFMIIGGCLLVFGTVCLVIRLK